MIVDAASLTFTMVTASEGTQALPVVGLMGYALGGPTTHLLHDRPGAALGSLGLRVGAPLLLGGLAYAAVGSCERVTETSCDSPAEGLGRVIAAFFGGMVGVAIAVGVDAAVLSFEEKPRPPEPRVHVGFGPVKQGGELVVSGTF